MFSTYSYGAFQRTEAFLASCLGWLNLKKGFKTSCVGENLGTGPEEVKLPADYFSTSLRLFRGKYTHPARNAQPSLWRAAARAISRLAWLFLRSWRLSKSFLPRHNPS